MTYPPPTTPPAGPPQPVYAPPPSSKRVPVWPFIVGGAVLLLIVLGVIAAFAIPAYQQRQAEAQLARDEQAVEDAVIAFDEAYESADCDDYEAVTDEDYREDWWQENFDEDYDCEAWEENAEGFTVDGDYTYSVEVDEVEVKGDRATVITTEESGEGESGEFEYELERTDDGEWLIVSYEEV